MAVLEHNKRNQTQDRTKHGQYQSCILAAHVVEECVCEERRHSTQCVSHQPLTRDSRGRRLAVAVCSVRVCALKDEEDAKGNGCKADNWSDPGQVSVLCERVDEKANREPD